MSIAIIGCGWLGTPLAVFLINRGYKVLGTTTNPAKIPDLTARGIKAGIFDLNSRVMGLPMADRYVINIPPSKVNNYGEKIQKLAVAIPKSARQVIFCSTTSVYGDTSGTITETDVAPGEPLAGGQADVATHGTPVSELRAAEGAFFKHPAAVILRLAGLIGNDRNPVKYFAGRSGISHPLAPVNLIHLDELLPAIHILIEQGVTGEVFNVCSSLHPPRNEYYTETARKLGFAAPRFDQKDTSSGKTVDSGKIIRRTGTPLVKLF